MSSNTYSSDSKHWEFCEFEEFVEFGEFGESVEFGGLNSFGVELSEYELYIINLFNLLDFIK